MIRVQRADIFSSPFLGLYAIATDKAVLLPANFQATQKFSDVMGVPAIRAAVYGSPLVGIFASGNSKGILVPKISKVPETGGNVTTVSDKITALGNTILANDNGAVISRDFSREAEEQIKQGLGVDEVVRGTVAGSDLVGSCGIATNRGCLLHSRATESEIETIKSVLKVKVGLGSLNRGSDYVGSCAVANSTGAIVGAITTPIEITRLEEALS